MELQQRIESLFVEQKQNWAQLDSAIKQLGNISTKEFNWGDDNKVVIQFNPARVVSSTAKVDAASIEERPCFLCEKNRPDVQKGIEFLDKYIILANPFPILDNHLTIALHSHVPQRIRKKIGDILSLAEQLPDYIIFYNGPKCGASAPDHFHMQAGLKSDILMQGYNELRACLIIEGDTKEDVESDFEDVYHYLSKRQPDEDEPMMNIIAFVDQGKYVLHIFPRKAHRPGQYHDSGKRQLMISPGAIDMAGLIITVREEDFNKIRKEDIEDIYSQVSMSII